VAIEVMVVVQGFRALRLILKRRVPAHREGYIHYYYYYYYYYY